MLLAVLLMAIPVLVVIAYYREEIKDFAPYLLPLVVVWALVLSFMSGLVLMVLTLIGTD